MRKLIAFFLVFSVVMPLFAEEKKAKVAVMEIEDRSATLDVAMLGNAAEYLRGELAATNRFVLISKDRQRDIIIKEQKKESWKECKDQTCRVQLGQALSADTLLQSSINLFGGIYTLTVEMVDLAKEATIKGAKAKFDGTETGLMAAIDKILLQIADRPVTFDPGTVQTKDVKGVEIGTVSLSSLPAVQVENTPLVEIDNKTKINEMKLPDVIETDVNPDILVLYDNALKADKSGKEQPEAAIEAWAKLVAYSTDNPYLKQAQQRLSEWKHFVRMRDLGARYKLLVAMDPYGKFFPEKIIALWRSMVKDANGTPYEEIATKRVLAWEDFTAKVKAYKDKQESFARQHGLDIEKLVKLLPLDLFNEGQKRSMLVRYLEAYAPFYGVEDMDLILDRLKDRNLIKRLRELVFNEFLNKEMYQKCEAGDAGACYIGGALKEIENPKEALNLFINACKNGVVNACIKAGMTRYEESNPEASEYFSIACSWESPQGCHNLGFLTEIGYGGKDKFKDLAAALYKKACQMGNQTSCLMQRNIEANGYSSDQAEAIIRKKENEEKIEATIETRDQKATQTVEAKKGTETPKVVRTEKIEETSHPYLWYGVGTIIGGVALAVGGGAAFGIVAKDKRDEYDKKMLSANIDTAVAGGIPREQYIKDARKLWDDSQTFEALEYTFIAVGCAAVAGGIVLAVWPEKHEVIKELSFLPMPGGFVVAAGFEF